MCICGQFVKAVLRLLFSLKSTIFVAYYESCVIIHSHLMFSHPAHFNVSLHVACLHHVRIRVP